MLKIPLFAGVSVTISRVLLADKKRAQNCPIFKVVTSKVAALLTEKKGYSSNELSRRRELILLLFILNGRK